MCIKLVSKKYFISALLIALWSVFLVGCGSDGEKRPQYMDADTVKSLEIPPKLTAPDTRAALRLPKPLTKKEIIAESKVIAPAFSGFELKNDSRLYWLEIDMSVAEVWNALPGFLASEGIEVDRVEKLLGFIDTKWMSEYKVTYNAEENSSWFSKFSPDYKDRFRIRLEAIQGKNKTRMYVNHRGLQISVASDITDWVQRDSEPFLEREIMYRFILYSGIDKVGASELLASYKSYQPRVSRVSDASDVIDVRGEADTIWLRLQIAMDRLGVDTLKTDKKSSTMTVLVGNLKESETPENEDSGWFSGLFGGKEVDLDDNENYEASEYKAQPEQVAPEDKLTLQVTQVAGKTSSKIKISHEDGSVITEKLALMFRDALLRQLK